ncbi:MAG: PEGA domain-containing protein [Deltaproteobacteria bacterium]|nr:PEGA domain-containing protein [Deltaproteobacteria bacterium]
MNNPRPIAPWCAFVLTGLFASTSFAQDAAPAAVNPAVGDPNPNPAAAAEGAPAVEATTPRVKVGSSPKITAPGLEELPVEVLSDKPVEVETPAPPIKVEIAPQPEKIPEVPEKKSVLPKPTLPRLLVLNLIDKGAGAQITEALSEAMTAQALKSHPGEVVTVQQLELALRAQETQQSLGCEAMSCFTSLGEITDAETILSGTVSKVGRDILVTLRTVNPGDGSSKNLQRKVSLHQDLYYYATRQLTSLLLTGQAVNTRVPVRIGASLEGVSVLVDGQGAGFAPLTIELDPGFHDVRLSLDGYVPWRTQIEVEETAPLEVYAILVEEGLTLWPAALVSASLGAVTLGGAGVLFAYASNAYNGAVPIPAAAGGYENTNTYIGLQPADKAALRERQRAVQVFYFGSVATAAVGTVLVGVGGVLLAADLFE